MATKKRKKTAKKPAKPALTERFGDIWQSEYAGWMKKKLGILTLLAVLATMASFGFGFLEKYVQNINRSRDIRWKVELKVNSKEPPRWVSYELRQKVCLSTEICPEDDFSDPQRVKSWNANLAKNPWVKKIHHLRKRYDGMLEIDCELRQPLAWIQANPNLCYYVDAEGVVLPPLDTPTEHLVQLQGGDQKFLRPGMSITSKSLLAGIEVLAEIRKRDEIMSRENQLWPELDVMDVSNFEGHITPSDSHLVIYTSDNTEILWGAAKDRELPYCEAPLVTKLEHLYRSHKQYNSLGVYEFVELRYQRKNKADPLRQPQG